MGGVLQGRIVGAGYLDWRDRRGSSFPFVWRSLMGVEADCSFCLVKELVKMSQLCRWINVKHDVEAFVQVENISNDEVHPSKEVSVSIVSADVEEMLFMAYLGPLFSLLHTRTSTNLPALIERSRQDPY